MQELGWLPVLNSPMWHTDQLLSQDSALGDVLHSFFGYSDSPTPLQLLVYVGYLAIVLTAYLGGPRVGRRAQRKTSQVASQA
jgi:high-affinity iron transporter